MLCSNYHSNKVRDNKTYKSDKAGFHNYRPYKYRINNQIQSYKRKQPDTERYRRFFSFHHQI